MEAMKSTADHVLWFATDISLVLLKVTAIPVCVALNVLLIALIVRHFTGFPPQELTLSITSVTLAVIAIGETLETLGSVLYFEVVRTELGDAVTELRQITVTFGGSARDLFLFGYNTTLSPITTRADRTLSAGNQLTGSGVTALVITGNLLTTIALLALFDEPIATDRTDQFQWFISKTVIHTLLE